VIVCQTITVNNPATTTGTVDAAFSQTFTQSGAIGTATFTTSSTLPTGITLNSSTGVLSGTPGQPGTFPIVVTVTDSNGCTGTSSTYNLVIACQTITVTNPATTTGTVDAAFSQTFTQSGVGTHTPITWSISGALPSGLIFNTSTGVLSGTPGQPGNFPVTVTATDVNGCAGTGATYNLVIACQTITVTNPGVSTAVYNSLFSQTFTQSGVGTHTPAVWSVTGTLPAGITINTSTGVLSGTPTQTGTFPITVTATDANGCAGTGATYTLTVAPVAVADSFSNAAGNTQYVLTGGTTATPSTPTIQIAGTIEVNDLPSAAQVTVVAGTFATANGGSVTIAADGTFLYTPPAQPGVPQPATDSFTYTVSSDTGSTGTPVTSAPATVTINLGNRVWYVKNDYTGTETGRSHEPFNTLVEAQGASTANDIIYVYAGNGTTSGQNNGFVMKNGQKLYGQGIALVVNSQTLVGPGSQPQIGNVLGTGVNVTNLTGIEIRGLNIGGATDGINAVLNVASTVTIEISNNTIRSAGNEGIDIDASAGVYLVSIHDLSAVATGTAIDVAESGTGQIVITAFDDLTIPGTTAATGIAVTGATFDTASGAPFTSVNAGAINVGTPGAGNGAGTNGIVLTNVAGDLSFTNLNVFAENGTALSVTGTSSTFNAGAGTGFRLVANGGTDLLSAVNGPAVNISTSNITLAPSSITSSGSTTFGLNFSDVSGSFSSAGSISGLTAAATAYRITGSSLNATYTGTINITQGAGVSLTTNTGIYTFTGALTMSTGAANAFVATSSGTVTSNNAASDLTTTTGTAVNITSTIGAAGVQFRSVNSATATSNAVINLSATGAGAFSITGTGTTAGSGGTIDNKSADAITISNTGGLVTFKNMIIEDIGSTAGAFNTISGHDAIHAETINGGMALDNMTIRRISDNAINGTALAGGGDTVFNGLTINNSTIQFTNRYHVAGTGDGNNEGGVRIRGIRGTVSVTNTTIEDSAEMLDFFVTGGTLTLTVTNSNFNRSYKEFTSGGLASVGGHCIDVTNFSNATANIGDIGNAALGNDFLNCRLGSVRVVNDAGSTGNVSTVIGRNNFVVTDHSSGTGGDFDFPMGGVLVWSLASGTTDARITANYFNETTRASGALGSIGALADLGTYQARIDGNTFDTLGDGTWVTRSKNGANARVRVDNNTYINGTFVCPDPACAGGYQGPALYQLAEAQEGGTLHLTNSNETYSNHDNSFYPGNSLETRVNNVGAASTMCVALANLNSPRGYALEQYAGTYNLYRGASGASGTCTAGTCPGVLAANSAFGGVVAGVPTPSKNPPDVTVAGTINLQVSPCNQPSGSIF
jgi:hypothetical protein